MFKHLFNILNKKKILDKLFSANILKNELCSIREKNFEKIRKLSELELDFISLLKKDGEFMENI